MDTLTKSCSPTIVITTNGEVQTHEEVTVYVKELKIFLTLKDIENTSAVLSRGKLCDENVSHEWINGQRTTYHSKRGLCNTENFLFFFGRFQGCRVRPLDLHQLQGHLRDTGGIHHHLQLRLLHVQ